MESNFYIASRLAKVVIADEEMSRISAFFQSIKDKIQIQYRFFNYCKEWKLAPWIFIQLSKHNLIGYFNDDVQKNFRDVYNRVKTENENRSSEALNFLKIFNDEGIDVALLKGNLFIHTVYNDTGYKKMNDFDMLVHLSDWPKIQEIYHKLGYIPLGNGWSGEKGDAAKFSHAGLSFLSPNYKCITGTQWGLKSPTSKYKVDINDLWATALDFDYHGVGVKQLSAEYNILHLILHMGTYKCGIRDCMDIYNLMLTGKNIDYNKLANIIKNSNTTDKAWFTLNLTDKCSDAVDKSFLNELNPAKKSFLVRRLESRLKMSERTGDMQLSYNDQFHEVEMIVFYFGLFHVFHKKLYFFLKLVRQMFFPPKSLAYKLSDLDENSGFLKKIKARIKAPYFVFSLIGEEIGIKITFLLFVKLMVDTLLSIRFYFVKKEVYFEYLRKRGIDPQDIRRVVQGIQ
jgi:hypothetical protein